MIVLASCGFIDGMVFARFQTFISILIVIFALLSLWILAFPLSYYLQNIAGTKASLYPMAKKALFAIVVGVVLARFIITQVIVYENVQQIDHGDTLDDLESSRIVRILAVVQSCVSIVLALVVYISLHKSLARTAGAMVSKVSG